MGMFICFRDLEKPTARYPICALVLLFLFLSIIQCHFIFSCKEKLVHFRRGYLGNTDFVTIFLLSSPNAIKNPKWKKKICHTQSFKSVEHCLYLQHDIARYKSIISSSPFAAAKIRFVFFRSSNCRVFLLESLQLTHRLLLLGMQANGVEVVEGGGCGCRRGRMGM